MNMNMSMSPMYYIIQVFIKSLILCGERWNRIRLIPLYNYNGGYREEVKGFSTYLSASLFKLAILVASVSWLILLIDTL